MSKTLNYGLIGATGIGGYHLDALREFVREGTVKLAGIADPAFSKLPDLRTELIQQGSRVYLNYEDMLDELNLDVVVISVPIPLHLEIALACLERDIFVYLEKPPVPLIQQWECLKAADKHQRIGVGFQMIHSERIQEIKKAISSGHLGVLKSIRVGACWPRLDAYYNRNSSAGKMSVGGKPVFDGPATNALSHLIHNIMFLAGSGHDAFDTPYEIQAELYRARPIESYDIACLRGHFRSGVTFSAALTHATEELLPYALEVCGTEGWARISNDGTIFESSFSSIQEQDETFEVLLRKTQSQFLGFVQGKERSPSTSLIDTRGYLLATNGMLLSSGDIYEIDADYARRYQRGDTGGHEVSGLREAVQTSYQTGKLFSEQGLPWAVKTTPVSVENLKCLTVESLNAGGILCK